ncbi:MAG: tRNA(Ile)-lysidine synthetase [Myxococcaceae bacterium]|nr:tRNA(Ile)-lysidine synthetase [Myxococcaceae bacterium]
MLVACSGGPDSQVLLSVLHTLGAELGFQVTAAGVDHGLRPEARDELALAAALAHRLTVPFKTLQVVVPSGASRQAAAREARYAALLLCAKEHAASAVAVGHTRDDQAETVLARILRGTGVEGLAAAWPRRADGVVRPLIDCPRSWVEAYVAEAELEVARDPSNLDPRYLRVRVRSELLPLLTQESPKLAEHLAHLADDARETAELLRECALAALARAGGDTAVLREEAPLVRRWALKLLVEREAGVPLMRAHLTALERMLWSGGQVRVPGDVVVSVDPAGKLSFSPVAKRGRGATRPMDGSVRSDRRAKKLPGAP